MNLARAKELSKQYGLSVTVEGHKQLSLRDSNNNVIDDLHEDQIRYMKETDFIDLYLLQSVA